MHTTQAIYDPVDAPLDVIKEAIEDMGFDAELLLPVGGNRMKRQPIRPSDERRINPIGVHAVHASNPGF